MTEDRHVAFWNGEMTLSYIDPNDYDYDDNNNNNNNK